MLVEKTRGVLFNLSSSEFEKKFRNLVKKSSVAGLSIAACNEQCFDSAYGDFLAAIKTTKALSKAMKKTTGKGFAYPESLNFKTKKQGGNSIEIRSRDITYNAGQRSIRFFGSYFNKQTIKMKTNLAKLGFDGFNYSCRLNMVGEHYYLNVPYVRVVLPTKTNRVCAIDPGVRSFLTGYDPTGHIFEIATHDDLQHLYKKKARIEKLQTVIQSTVGKMKRDKISQEIRNIYRKIKNCVNDMHHKASKVLAENYDEILLPAFETQKMVSNNDEDKKRQINGKTAYNMLTLSHYKFQQLLKHKMEQRGGKLHICTEEYTSKTCGHCGRLNHKLGSSKRFVCPFPDCEMIADRDRNAARNIFIKNINLVSDELLRFNYL